MKENNLIQYLFLVLGTLSMSFGTVTLLSPNEIITGGGIGIALLIHHLFPEITLGTFIVLVSIPFIILGFIFFGKKYTFKTFLTMILLSFFTDFFKEFLNLPPIANDTLLGAIFGGIFIGLGVGLVIKGRSSTGSTSVVGELVALKTKYKAAEALLCIDAVIIFSSIFVYGNVEKSLYSLLGVYVTSKVIDMVLSGRPSKKIVNIVSTKSEELKVHIREGIEEHGTIMSGIGLHEGQEKTVIFITVEASKLQLLKELVFESDPDAFLIVTEASQMLGRD